MTEKSIQEIIPLVQKKNIQEVTAVVGIIQKGNKYFIQQRPSKGLLADLWEFPGGKVEKGESLEKALKREIKEELNTEVIQLKSLGKVVHFYTQFKVALNAFIIKINSNPETNLIHKWIPFKSFNQYPMPSGSAKIVELLKA